MLNKILVFGAVFGAAISSAHGAKFRSGEDISLGGQYTENIYAAGGSIRGQIGSKDDVFLAGGSIDLSLKTERSAFVAGGEVDLKGARADLGVLAGGQVEIEAGEFRELIAAGGQVKVTGARILDDFIVGAGDFTVAKDSSVVGDLIVGAGAVNLAGSFGGESWIRAGKAVLRGVFKGNVDIQAEELRIESGTSIEGNLTYGAKAVSIASDVKIKGKQTVRPFEGWRTKKALVFFFLSLLLGLGISLLGPLLASVWPRLAREGVERIRKDFWRVLGKGTLASFVLPLSVLALTVTVVGLPAALAVLSICGAAHLVAASIAALLAGDQLRLWIAKKKQSGLTAMNRRGVFLWSWFGAVALLIVFWIPLLGFVVMLLVSLASFGAVVTKAQEWVKRG